MNFYLKILLFSFFLLNSIQPQEFWEKVNGPPGGRIPSIAVSPSGTSIVCGSQDPGRIYVSTDLGQNWIQSDYRINQISDRVSDIIYVSDSVLYEAGEHTVYRSTDCGFTWNYANLQSSRTIWSLAVDSSGYLFAGLENPGQIYRSTDSGSSWHSVVNVTGRVWDLYIDHRNVIFAGCRGGIIRSTDQGISWENCSGFPGNISIWSITSDTTGLMFGICGVGPTYLFYSTNFGLNWFSIDSVTTLNEFQAYNVLYANNRLYLAGDKGVIVSIDSGYSWEYINNGFYQPRARNIIEGKQDEIYAAMDGSGVFKTTNYGNKWLPLNNGLINSGLTRLVFDEQSNIYASPIWNAPYKSTDGGNSWVAMLNGINSFTFQSIYYTNSKILFLGTENGLFRSYNKGDTFELLPAIGANFFEMISEDKRGVIYVCTHGTGLWRSKDNGDNWEFISASFSNQYTFSFTADSSGNIYAGARYGKIYRSTDSGDNWQEITNGITATGTVFTMTSSPKSYIYAGVLNGGVFRSTDRGNNWVEVNNGILNYVILYITSNKKNELFASNDEGFLYYSDDDGESWIDASFNLFPATIWDIEFDKEGYIYLGTDESVWKSVDTIITSVVSNTNYEQPSSYKLHQNYPNPFNPTTKIRFEMPERNFITIKVYDILGREIATLVNEYKSSGSYEVKFDASGLSSGIYLYTLSTVNFFSTKKMILIK